MPIPQNAQLIWNALISAGAAPVSAAGILGNIMQESGGDPELHVMDSNGAYSWGLVMFNDAGAGAGHDYRQYITGNVEQDIVNQVRLLVSEGGLQAAVGSTPQEAAANFMNSFERPAAAYANEANRVNSAGDVFAAAQSGSWGTSIGNIGAGYTPQSNPSTAFTGGGNIYQQPGSSVAGLPLTPADLPTIINWIKQNWGSYAWLLSQPEVASVLEQAAVQGLSTDQVQAKIEQTNWWRTTSAAMRQFEQDMALNPADYQFGSPGSKASSEYTTVANEAGSLGVLLSTAQIQSIAMDALRYGWGQAQIQAAIGSQVSVAGPTQNNAMGIVDQLISMGNQYYQTLTPQTLQSWAENIAAGTQNMQQFQASMAKNAAMKWTGYAQQLLGGETMMQLTDNLRQEAAKTMEIDPSSIDFTKGPWSQIIDYVPPNPPGAKAGTSQPHRVMTLSEMDQYLKNQRAYAYTQNARDSVAQLEQQIVQDFGRAPSQG
jgi:hypothetical protein